MEIRPHPDFQALPCTPHNNLAHYYVHITEYTEKVKADLKAAGCWPADRHESTPSRITDIIGALTLGVKESNMLSRQEVLAWLGR